MNRCAGRSKEYAAKNGMTLTAFVEDALCARVAEPPQSENLFKLVLKTVRGSNPVWTKLGLWPQDWITRLALHTGQSLNATRPGAPSQWLSPSLT